MTETCYKTIYVMSKILGCWYVSIYIKKRGGVEGLNQKMNSDYLQAVDLEVIFSLFLV